MADPHVLTGLIAKRAELAGQIEHAQDKLRQLVIDLDHIDAAIHIFDPTIELVEIKVRPVPPKGLVRVYPSSAVRKKLGADASEEFGSEVEFIARATRADRYREVPLYCDPDCRLRFTKDICPWLGFALGEEVPLYIQAFPNGLEIMTIEHRFERLIAAKADILPWAVEALDLD